MMHENKYKINLIVFVVLLVLGWGGTSSFAQNYPIQITTQLAPPFSGFIPDYSTPGNQNLKLLVVFTDFTKPSYNIKLQLKITGQGITIQSKSYYYSGPITLQPGTPIEISGSDLSGLLNSANMDFSGINAQQYQTNSLPEGYYNICFTAYDYNNLTPIQVSNQSCAFGWMVLSDPPFLNLPFCESTVNVNTPQNMMFQWTPMNMNSPNSANSTLYDFELYEVRPGSQSPGNIIQTLPPIYQTTTPFTFLNYGITEPQLYYGMQYVWRVRARDQSGRDLFKNQGYSQLCTFTYGSVLSQIDTNSLKLTLQGTALTYRLAKYTWDSLSIFLSYKLEYRKQGSPNWFPVNTTTCKSIVNNLEPENTYEARVKGIFSEGDGPWSNVVTITTPAKPVIVCGQGGIPPLASNFIPLKTGNIAQVWNIGQFDMLVTQLDTPNNPNGKYSGYGKIAIPFLANMNLNGKFINITVNEAMEVVEGKVEITTTGIDAWLQQWVAPPGWNETDSLHYNGSISSVTSDTGTIFINGQPFGNTGGNTLITDNNGNTYFVSADGSISTPEGPLEAPISDTITSIPDSLQNIVFTDGDNAQFAFDSKEISSQTAGKNYDMLQKGSETYPVACKLLQTGAQDNLTATLGTAALEINTNSLIFKRSDGTIIPSTHIGDTYQLTVKGKLNLFADALWAFAKKKNSTDTTMYAVGKINLISVDKKKKKIVIIPVNSIGINTDAASLQAQINAIYKKVAVEWEVTKAADLQVPGYTSDSLLNVTRSALNITYGADLRKIINAYKAVDLSIDDATSYLFLVNKATNNDLGYMALNKKFGFIFLDNNGNIPYTIAHEIGHGSLVLEHTFTGETGGTSQNLLDYNNGELFNQRQFKAIHDPNLLQNLLIGLVQDEDAGAFYEKKYFAMYNMDNLPNESDGIVPKWFWNNQTASVAGLPAYSGFIDAIYNDLTSLGDLITLYNCWATYPYSATKNCEEIRTKSLETGKFVLQFIYCTSNPTSIYINDACSKINKSIKSQVSALLSGVSNATLPEVQYNYGKAVWFLGSMFIGVGEVNAVVKAGITSTRLASVVTKTMPFLAAINAICAEGVVAKKVGNIIQFSKQGINICSKSETGVIIVQKELDASSTIIAQIGKQKVSVNGQIIEKEIAFAKNEAGEVGIVTSLKKFSLQQIDDYVLFATQNKNANKVMLGKYDAGGSTSYIQRAGNNHTYFDMGPTKWAEAEALVGANSVEMWKINKQFIDEQKVLGKEFYFSHEPWNAQTHEYLSKEAEYLIDLGATDFQKINVDTWKIIW